MKRYISYGILNVSNIKLKQVRVSNFKKSFAMYNVRRYIIWIIAPPNCSAQLVTIVQNDLCHGQNLFHAYLNTGTRKVKKSRGKLSLNNIHLVILRGLRKRKSTKNANKDKNHLRTTKTWY